MLIDKIDNNKLVSWHTGSSVFNSFIKCTSFKEIKSSYSNMGNFPSHHCSPLERSLHSANYRGMCVKSRFPL